MFVAPMVHGHGHARYNDADVPRDCLPHSSSGGDAIAGGFIYRGTRIPGLKGKLLFGDITTGRIWYAEMADILDADGVDVRFAEDSAGELYLLTTSDGMTRPLVGFR